MSEEEKGKYKIEEAVRVKNCSKCGSEYPAYLKSCPNCKSEN